MSLFDFVGKFILFIIPGGVCFSIITYLTGKKLAIDVLSTVYIFTLSVISYIMCNFSIWLIDIFKKQDIRYADIGQALSGNPQAIETIHIVLSVFSSVILGLFITLIISKKLLFKITYKLKISNRTGNEDVWDNLFSEQQWIIFRDYVSEKTYYGRAMKASDNKDEREIILEEVTVSSEAGEELYKMSQIYFCRKSSEFSIEIDDYNKGGVNNATKPKERFFVQL